MDIYKHLSDLRESLVSVTQKTREENNNSKCLIQQHPKLPANHRTLDTSYLKRATDSLHTIVISPTEVNDNHGTGLLIKRLFTDDSQVLHIHSRSQYESNTFGADSMQIQRQESRADYYRILLSRLNLVNIERVFCVPFFPEDLNLAIALSELYHCPLAIYIMDDQNVSYPYISDQLMKEALEKSTIRFAISCEMRNAYEDKYGLKFYILPPLIDSKLVCDKPVDINHLVESAQGIMLGNLWDSRLMEPLRSTLNQSGLKIDWFGNAAGLESIEPELLAVEGITYRGVVPEHALASLMKKYSFGILPVAEEDLGAHDWLAKYSLPTRLITSIASGNLPMVIIGSRNSAASLFTQRFNLGETSRYDTKELQDTVAGITEPQRQQAIRNQAARLSHTFSNHSAQDWLKSSISNGCPSSNIYENLLHKSEESLSSWIEPPVASDIPHYLRDMTPVFSLIKRLAPPLDFVVDVGCSVGIFSYLATKMLSTTKHPLRCILIDPQLSAYRAQTEWYLDQLHEYETHEIALADREGEIQFHATDDMYNSSIFRPSTRSTDPKTVPMTTLEKLSKEFHVKGKGLLKIDVQGAEHLVLKGAGKFMQHIDIVMVETSLRPIDPDVPDFYEIFTLMRELGFRYMDDSGGWRSPANGIRLQQDCWFIRENLSWYKEHFHSPF